MSPRLGGQYYQEDAQEEDFHDLDIVSVPIAFMPCIEVGDMVSVSALINKIPTAQDAEENMV